MKTFLTSLVLGLSVSALAQESRTAHTSTSINDDGQMMSIQVEGSVNGKDISYNRRFDVRGMTGADKEALKGRIYDSLGVGEPPKPPVPPVPPKPPVPASPPVPPTPPTPSTAPEGSASLILQCDKCTGKGKLRITGEGFSMEREFKNEGKQRAFPMQLTLNPGEYRYQYWQNGVLQMQLPFTVKEGETNVVTVK